MRAFFTVYGGEGVRLPREILEEAYTQALREAHSDAILSVQQQEWVRVIAHQAESQKAVMAALMTSLVKKIATPEQDIRLHKVEMAGGYSGRSFDTAFVTPFIQEKFPRLAMRSGSGWLTRSIEQNHPFTRDFAGKIQNARVKHAFLEILNDIQENAQAPLPYLNVLLAELAGLSLSGGAVVLPTLDQGTVTIADIIELLRKHFFHDYHTAGASRLPVLAIYAIYELLMELPRYQGKRLLPLKSHTTSDTKSRSYADIEVVGEAQSFFEGVEIKHGIPITPKLTSDAYDKFAATPASRYYLLTTAEPNVTDSVAVEARTRAIRQEHGCEVIVNGLLPSPKYYLRLLPEPTAFLRGYSLVLQADFDMNTDIKRTHLEYWHTLAASLANQQI